MTASTITAEDLTNSVAQNIAERLKLNPDKIVTKLVASLTKNLLKSVATTAAVQKPFDNQVKIPQVPVVQKPLDNQVKPTQPSVIEPPVNKQVTIPQTAVVQKPLETLLPAVNKQDYVKDSVNTQAKIPQATVIQKPLEDLKQSAQPDYSKAQESVFEKENKFLFDGFTDRGLNKLKEELPSIIKKGVSDLISGKTEKKADEPAKPGGSLLAGLGILGGIAGLLALLYGLQTDGPFKGLSKLVSRGLLSVSGFTKMFDGVVKKMLRYLIKLPNTLLKSFSKAILPMLGQGAGSTLIKTGLEKLTGFLPKFLGGALKLLKKVPFVGSLISIGFAVSRFKSGDYIGGGLDILSGVANAFGLAPLSWAIDGLNAFLDYKAGGTGEDKKSKGAILLDLGKSLGAWMKEIVNNMLKSIVGYLPEDLFGFSIRNRVAEMLGIDMGPAVDNPPTDKASTEKAVSKSIKEPAKPSSPSTKGEAAEASDKQTMTPVADAAIDPSGGLVVSSPQEGSLFQLSKNDGVVAAPVAKDTPTGTSNTAKVAEQTYNKSDSILEKIAQNTQATNDGLSNLASGFTALAKALEKMGSAILEKPAPMPTIINQQSGGSQDAKVRSTQAAKAGNSNIANFRQNMEMLRQRPA